MSEQIAGANNPVCPFCGGAAHKRGVTSKGRPTFRCTNPGCKKNFSEGINYEYDRELVEENVKIAKRLQGAQDRNRIANKSFREHARIENAVAEYSEKILEVLNKYDFSKVTIKHEEGSRDCVGIVHLSDLHFNELVASAHNTYDFRVAAQRLKYFAVRAKAFFKPLGIKRVLLANTGDNLNSDRRLDEYLSQATNRSNATMLSVYLLEQFILDLNKDFNLKVAFVTGNESRLKDEPGWSQAVASDNYDYVIFNILRYGLRTAKGIDFVLADPTETVVDVAGQNVLLIHGNQIRGTVEQTVQKIVGKYAARGVLISYVIFGDVHSTRIGDIYSRSASMVGGNDYSDKGLQLASRASQNLYVFWKNGNRDGIKVDLQNVGGIEGYDIKEELVAYNAKSAAKLHEGATIMRIVI